MKKHVSELKRVTLYSIILMVVIMVFATDSNAHVVTHRDCLKQATAPFVDTPTVYQECVRRAAVHALNHQCLLPRPVIRHATVKHARANRHQRRMLTLVLNIGRTLNAHSRVQRSAITAMTQESSATNVGGGSGTSVGLFQLIDSWGSFEQRHNPEFSTRWYFARAIPIHRRNPGIGIGALSQAVERSAYPSAYDQWIGESGRTYKAFIGRCTR